MHEFFVCLLVIFCDKEHSLSTWPCLPKSKIFLCSPCLINLSFWNPNCEWIYFIFLFVIILVLVLLLTLLLFTLFCYSLCCSPSSFSYSPPPFCDLIHHVATSLLCSFIGLVVNTIPFCNFVLSFVASPPLHGLITDLVVNLLLLQNCFVVGMAFWIYWPFPLFQFHHLIKWCNLAAMCFCASILALDFYASCTLPWNFGGNDFQPL